MPTYAIITSDLQYAAANKNLERQQVAKPFIPKLASFLTEMRNLSLPIIHLQLVHKPDDPRSSKQPDELKFTPGSQGVRLLPEILQDGDIVIKKPKDSGFFETNLNEILQEKCVDSIILTGMQTQICIQTTAADGYFRGYHAIVPADGVLSHNLEDTQRALEWMGSYCATITTMQEISEYLRKGLAFKKTERN
jgi:nicotinamidase-related amidase